MCNDDTFTRQELATAIEAAIAAFPAGARADAYSVQSDAELFQAPELRAEYCNPPAMRANWAHAWEFYEPYGPVPESEAFRPYLEALEHLAHVLAHVETR